MHSVARHGSDAMTVVFAVAVLTLAAAPGLGAAYSTVVVGEQLPRRPEVDCNRPAVVSAITRCSILGVNGTSCCSGLDRVFADQSSPSYGCLCFPPVLYQAVSRTAALNINLLGILRQCQTLYTNFTTQWAGAVVSGCPSIPMDVNAVKLAPFLGAASLTDKAATVTPHWAWQNLLQWGEADSWDPHVGDVISHVFGIGLVQIMLGVFVGLPFVFLAVHRALIWTSSSYRSLAESQRLVTLQHGVYAVLFGLSMVPQTWLVLHVLFFTPTGNLIVTNELTYLLGLFVTPRFSLYLLEAVTRSLIKPNPLLVGLRIASIATGFIVVLTKNPAVLSMALLMDLGAVFEAPLFATLVSRRLQWPMRLTRTLLRAGIAWYVLTRVFQLVVLVYMVVGFAAMHEVNLTPEFFMLSAAYLAYSAGSVLTVVIYCRIDLKLPRADVLPRVADVDGSGSSAHGSWPTAIGSRGSRSRTSDEACKSANTATSAADMLVRIP